jgi:hypothetical protein
MSISWTTESNTTSLATPCAAMALTYTGYSAVISAVPYGVSWNSCRSADRPLPAEMVFTTW